MKKPKTDGEKQKTGLRKEATVLLAIAKVIDKLPDDETRCAVLAQAAIRYRLYDEALAFIYSAMRAQARDVMQEKAR